MALRYLPFRSSDRIIKASSNAPPMGFGEAGTAVAILQQALIDYGYPMPISTWSGGPDGIFGKETKTTVSEFQRENHLGIDGIAGRNTINRLDSAMTTGPKAQPPRRVTLHFRSLTLTNVPFEIQFLGAQQTYGQYNIEIVFGSGLSCGLTEEEARKFDKVEGECKWVITEGEMAELLLRGGAVPRNHIAVFFINRFTSRKILGCGGHLKNRPACIVAGHANRYDMAHEVGHVLLTSSFTPIHHTSTRNLMHIKAQVRHPNVPVLDPSQLAQIKRSPLCV